MYFLSSKMGFHIEQDRVVIGHPVYRILGFRRGSSVNDLDDF